METGHATADATGSEDVVAVDEDGVIIALLAGEELEVMTDGATEDKLEVKSEEAVPEVEAGEADEVLGIGLLAEGELAVMTDGATEDALEAAGEEDAVVAGAEA